MNYKILKGAVGVLFMVLGLAALVTPLTPGSWLIFVGAEMLGIGILSRENVLRLLNKLKANWKERKDQDQAPEK